MSARETADYEAFLAAKAAAQPPAGMEPPEDLPEDLKPFQRALVIWALSRGRAAIFAGTGLGKTLMQLSWADAVARHTGLPVLILTPLAVAHQTVEEAAKFGIAGAAYRQHSGGTLPRLTVANYDRLDAFDMALFGGVVLDESSIIKAHDSQTRLRLTESCACVPFRLCCTATPAPNDHVELGQHAEFLGVLRAKEMLATWFVHDGSGKADSAASHGKPKAEWRLKGHAQEAFWGWVAGWAALIRHPRDLGFDEPGYDLPPLDKRQVTVPATAAPPKEGQLFALQAVTLQERLRARKDSMADRVAAAAAIVNVAPDRPWLVWCNLNAEADALVSAIPGAVQVAGGDHPDIKSRTLLGFAHGRPRVLVTKPSIAGFGMNWQHCADMVFVGLNDSYEQLYQAIRRCWRFGQTQPVTAWMVASELEGAVVANLERKERLADEMAAGMLDHMAALSRAVVTGGRVGTEISRGHQEMELPEWLIAA